MSELSEGRYFVVRYMLGELRDEAVNIGVIGIGESSSEISLRFLDDLNSKARVDVPFDARAVTIFREMLGNFVNESITGAEKHDTSRLERFTSILRENTGNLLRVNGPFSVLTDNIAAEIDHLFGELVAPKARLRRAVERLSRDPLGGLRHEARTAISQRIRAVLPPDFKKQSFKKAIAIRGQKHTSIFDAALVVRSGKYAMEHLFHHVLMLPDAEESFNQAASLLWKWQDVRERNGRTRELTAVLYSREGAKREGIQEAKSVLKKDRVQIAEVDQLAEVARMTHPQLRLLGH
jgi:Protein of unknown function (DUF3037)